MPVEAIPSQPYRDLVRARVTAGWDLERASAQPYMPRARLTRDEVEQVRTSTARSTEIARDLSITPRQVRRIRAGYQWKAA